MDSALEFISYNEVCYLHFTYLLTYRQTDNAIIPVADLALHLFIRSFLACTTMSA